MEYATLITRSDAIATCAERKQSVRAAAVAQRIAMRLRQLPAVSRPLGEQVMALTVSLEAEALENIALKADIAKLREERDILLGQKAAA